MEKKDEMLEKLFVSEDEANEIKEDKENLIPNAKEEVCALFHFHFLTRESICIHPKRPFYYSGIKPKQTFMEWEFI